MAHPAGNGVAVSLLVAFAVAGTVFLVFVVFVVSVVVVFVVWVAAPA